HPHTPTPLPYTTLFRSKCSQARRARRNLPRQVLFPKQSRGTNQNQSHVRPTCAGPWLHLLLPALQQRLAVISVNPRRSWLAPPIDRKSTRLNSSHVSIS